MRTNLILARSGFAALLSAAVVALNFTAAADPASTYSGPEKTFTGDVMAVDLSLSLIHI